MPVASRGLGRIGVLVPYTNTNLEPDMMLLGPAGLSFHFARIGGYDFDEVPDTGQMQDMGNASLEEPLRLLSAARPDVILYGCSSASLAHGPAFDRRLGKMISSKTGTAAITAAGALLVALKALNIERVGFASPYVHEVNDRAIDFFAQAGINAVSRADVDGTLGNYQQGEMTPDEIRGLACRADSDDAEAILLSCTDMRGVEAIEAIENELNKPVITSNQAMMYAALQALGLDLELRGFGRLFASKITDEA